MVRAGDPVAIDRRTFLGGLAALGMSAPLLSRVAHAATDTRLVVYWNEGGWDPTYVFDPHFESSVISGDLESVPATAGGLDFADAENRPSVRRVFEDFGDRAVVINGLAVGSISHTACARMMLTGSRDLAQADMASQIGGRLAGDAAIPFLALSGPRFPGDQGQALLSASPDAVQLIQDTQQMANEALVQRYLGEVALSPDPKMQAYGDALARLPLLLEKGGLLTGESDLQRAIAALNADLCRSLILQAELPMRTNFDSHQNNHSNQSQALEGSFEGLHTLLSALEGQGSLDRTLVLVLSEMGRTPVLNPGNGKDHWPYTSAMLIGGGISGGRLIGGTDDAMAAQGMDRESGEVGEGLAAPTSADLVGGVLQHLDLDPQELLPGCAPIRL